MSKIFTLAALLYFSTPIWGQAGILNQQFGGGIITTSFGSSPCQADDIAVQADGKLVAAGHALVGGVSKFALARYEVNGNLDNNFGTNGKVVIGLGSGCWFRAVAIQPDGKILAAGSVTNGPNVQYVLMRFLSNGTTDASFGLNGIATLIVGTYAYVNDIVLQPDGKILVAGEALINGDYDFSVARYHANGSLDLGFAGGFVVIDFNFDDYVKAITLQADGKILVAGSSNFRFALTRLNTSGEIDGSFGNEGRVTTSVGTVIGSDNALSMAIQPDGRIILAGEGFNPPYASDVALARYTPSGALDASFGSNGVVLTDIGYNFDQAAAVALQSDGKILVAANTTIMGLQKVAVMRYATQGILDPSFGNNGISVASIGNEAYVQAIQLHGNTIYMGGVAKNNPDQFAIFSFINVVPNASPLPVHMLDFTVQRIGSRNELRWTTEQEINTKVFQAEKSADGRNFTLLHELAAAGNSTGLTTYSTTDDQPYQGVSFYRIKTVDQDGAHTYSKIVAVKNLAGTPGVFPNPVRSVAQLQLPENIRGMLRIELHDAAGKMIKSFSLHSDGAARAIPVDMSYLVKGMYILSIQGAGMRFTEKLIKE